MKYKCSPRTPNPRHGDVTVTRSGEIVDDPPQAEEEHLRLSHGLPKVDAWVAVRRSAPTPCASKSDSASRMAKLRARRRDAGLVSIDVPAAVAAEIKAHGGWEGRRTAIT